MMDRYHLRYFLAVIDRGNFSKAAAACNVSQPTLSVGIAKLERETGQALFVRTNRRVELTEAGARLAAHARRIEAEFAAAEREVRGATTQTTVRLGLLPTLPVAWITSFLTRLGTAGGHERVELVEARERDLLDRLGRGRIDVALSLVRGDSGRFASEPWLHESYALALPASHPLAGRETIEAAELADNPMIVRRQCELLAETSRHFTDRGVRPFFAARTTDDERALALVRAGLGITVMPAGFAAEGVVRPRLADFAYQRTIGLLYADHVEPQQLRDGPALRALAIVLET